LTNADPAFSLHGAILLKAIRTTYNIFLLSKANDVQIVAQGTVTQMVQNVLSRIPNKSQKKKDVPNATLKPDDSSSEGFASNPALTNSKSNLEALLSPTEMYDILPYYSSYDREFKDAFKVFRTLCVLSVKSIPNPEGFVFVANSSTIELRSQPIRSKLLALHLLSTILQTHAYLFSMFTPKLFDLVKEPSGTIENFRFIDSVKEFLVLSLSRNATSMVLPIFEVSMELFGRIWIGLRSLLKKEMAVFFTEIVLPILEAKKNIPWYQRHCLLKSLTKTLSDDQGGRGQIVELYLNYDCDVEATAKENIWERLMNALAKITSQHVNQGKQERHLVQCYQHLGHGTPALTTNNLLPLSREQVKELFSVDGDAEELRKQGVALMAVGVLKPLVGWCTSRVMKIETVKNQDDKDEDNKPLVLVSEEETRTVVDDPTAIGFLKLRKQNVIEGVKKFNLKPKKGIQFLLETKCIESRTPAEISKFLMETEGLNKSMIGEFLGEGEEENIAIMHAFVERFDFVCHGFVDALRSFLQSFRLPGEAQKIDRFMLKFAEIYLKGNPDTFTSADTAYVLAYSVIMLNTDQHNAQVKRKMSKPDFLKNNRGIDGGKDISEIFLGKIFDEISTNEIIMKDEAPVKAALLAGKDVSNTKKTLSETSENMALKTEIMMRKGPLKKSAIDDKVSHFIFASHFAHVKPMFELIWMSVLTGLSTPLQECEDVETVMNCLAGVKNAIKITCIFEMELERNALLSTLSKFTLLSNIQEMREKNFEAIRTLLEIAYQEGGSLGTSWKDVVNCISQLEKLQLVGEGLEKQAESRKKDPTARQGKPSFIEEAAAVASSQMMTLSVDKIFSASAKLSGTAIVNFVRALCEVSWDEISTSVDKEQPRMYCLQRLVEISYYNMKRIRVEWSNIWAILGLHFNQVGSYPNTNVALFALDKLRQLALKFLEIEELPNFKFQKDFLRPFEEIIKSNPDPKIKDMCLVCVQQIIQVKGNSLKSGWKTLCGTMIRVGREVNGIFEFLTVRAIGNAWI
jgi:brefeldin A-inhibited guanine nucleotide-exchange protein